MKIMTNDSIAMRNYFAWLNSGELPAEIKKELRGIIGDPEEIEERFSGNLEFGTAGLRALMGVGTSRINVYTVAGAAYAVAECIAEDGDQEKGLIVSYDSRNNSKEFAEITARIAAEVGVKVLLSDTLRPVPMLSYAVREFGAAAGVMITASHNPANYNGFKVYGENGGQITPELAERIRNHFGSVTNAFPLVANAAPLEKLLEEGLVEYFGTDIDDSYNECVKARAESGRVTDEAKENIRIVYTPLNGSGFEPVTRALRELGYRSVLVVPEQMKPDGDFPTMRIPNPECDDTFDVAIKYAQMSIADIIIATDPDSDRLGVAIPDDKGDYIVLTGNQIGILLMEYILSGKHSAGTLPPKPFCVTSVVSTGLAERICKAYGVKMYKTLTGSKFIADLIKKRDEDGEESFIFGFEEGNGYMFGTRVRDKDAVTAAILVAEMAALSKANGQRLYEQFESIYEIYGYGCERSFSIDRSRLNGNDEIKSVMNHYRGLSGKLGGYGTELGEVAVTELTDYSLYSDVLYYRLKGDDWVAIRPSGTEPKLKIYVGCYDDTRYTAEVKADRLLTLIKNDIEEKILGNVETN